MLDQAYRSLGMLVHNGRRFTSDLLESQKFLKGNRRYTLKLDGPEVARTRLFLGKLLNEFAEGGYKHYRFPKTGLPVRGSEEKKFEKIDLNDFRTMRFKSEKLGKLSEEVKNKEIISVLYLASVDWVSVLQNKFDGL